MTASELIDCIVRLFSERGNKEYHGEAVNQLEHALQAATLAERDGQAPSLIVAALLHDIGHMLHDWGEHCAIQGIDDYHEQLAARFLETGFGPEVIEPIRLHVAAKRYLTATRAGYYESLSEASRLSLRLQGGPMTPNEVQIFEAQPYYMSAVTLREYDDQAKVIDMRTPSLTHFRRYLEAASSGR